MNTRAGAAASPPRRSTRTEQTKPKAAPRGRMERARVTRTPRETLQGRADAASTTEGFLEGIYVQKEMALQMV